MNPATIDRLAKRLSTRVSRRAAVLRGVTGAAATLGAAGLAGRTAAEGMPAATTVDLAANNATLFVQTATSGTFVPNPKAGTPAVATTGTPIAAQTGRRSLAPPIFLARTRLGNGVHTHLAGR